MHRDRKQMIKRVLVVVLTVAVLVAFIVFDPNLKDAGASIRQISPWWLLGAFGCMLVYYLGDTGMYLIGADIMRIHQPFGEGLLTTMVGMFYSAITPFASGGQPFQIVQMKHRGIPVGTSTCVLMIKFLAWHLITSLAGIAGAIAIGESVISGGTVMIIMFVIGLFVHVFCLTMGVLLLAKPQWVQRAGNWVLRLLTRMKRYKKHPEKMERMQGTWQKFIDDYREAMNIAWKHKGGMLAILLVCFVEIAAYMSVTYFVYRGLGFNETTYFTLLLTQAMLSISVAFIPLPGASVASEGGFYAVFSQFFGGARAVGMLIWRLLTYYVTILLGLLAVVIDGFRASKADRAAMQSYEPPSDTPAEQ